MIINDYVNQILNRDSLETFPFFPDDSVDLIITDPPYDFNQSTKEYIHKQLLRISKSWVIVFSPPENQWILPADQYLFWEKPISTKNTSRSYSRFVEMLFVYRRGVWNTERHWSQYTNVFKDLVDDIRYHSFRKPPSMIERLLLNHSDKGHLVFDPFSGSGVVAQIAKKNNRKFIGIEKDEKIWKQSIENLQKEV